jgi:hypothetical protein
MSSTAPPAEAPPETIEDFRLLVAGPGVNSAAGKRVGVNSTHFQIRSREVEERAMGLAHRSLTDRGKDRTPARS